MLATITATTELDENAGGYSAPIQGEIRFEQVSFGYQTASAPGSHNMRAAASSPRPSALVLRNITFTARPGETIAIVGQTGAGKTTLTRLVNRIYDATEGRILIDGVDVRAWNLDALRSQISTIEQDTLIASSCSYR